MLITLIYTYNLARSLISINYLDNQLIIFAMLNICQFQLRRTAANLYFLLSMMMVNKESLGFVLLVGQEKQSEDVTFVTLNMTIC